MTSISIRNGTCDGLQLPRLQRQRPCKHSPDQDRFRMMLNFCAKKEKSREFLMGFAPTWNKKGKYFCSESACFFCKENAKRGLLASMLAPFYQGCKCWDCNCKVLMETDMTWIGEAKHLQTELKATKDLGEHGFGTNHRLLLSIPNTVSLETFKKSQLANHHQTTFLKCRNKRFDSC